MMHRLTTAVTVVVALAACTTSAAEPTATTPKPTTVAPITTAPTTTTPVATTPPTTIAATTTPPTAIAATTEATTKPTGPVAVGGTPVLPGFADQLIDYVPDVANKLNIDVPGQYYELLPNFYAFIPTQPSTTNGNLQVPDPDDIPIIEAYVRAIAETWKTYTIEPVPDKGTPEMKAAYSAEGYVPFVTILEGASAQGIHTVIRGNMIIPRTVASARTESSALVLDCGWLDQYDLNASAEVVEDLDRMDGGAADIVVSESGVWIANRLQRDDQACS